MRNRKVLVMSLAIISIVLIYSSYSTVGNTFDWLRIINYLLWQFGLVSTIYYTKKELLNYADTLSSNVKSRQFYFYAQNRHFLGLKVGDILSILPMSFLLTSFVAFSIINIGPEFRNYYVVFELVIVTIILLLGLFMLVKLPLKSIERSIIPIFLFSTSLFFIAPLNFSQEKINMFKFFLFSSGFAFLNFLFYQICLSAIAFLKRHVNYEKVFQNIITTKNSSDAVLGVINSQKPIQILNKNNCFLIGNTDTNINITIVLNIFCKKSAKCLEDTHDLMLKNKEKVNLRILFNFHIYRDDYQRNLIRSLLHNYSLGADVVKILNACYKNPKEYTKYEIEGKNIEVDFYDHIIEKQVKWCQSAKIVECPITFLNGHKIPSRYKIEDFLEALETPLYTGYC
ncbi:hypothetical protein [Sphingobacterium faecale]|uniref:Uncharacterized protein n=1 Tax=Sphingobacterium faecale TaxID=2803775 RepID=A0ABS1R0H0_9SPHI|nr:hypothetical protein [Sphingobacterium faecale]MBL1408199.1 hypothetical protein [Sphingobacterium faecale]